MAYPDNHGHTVLNFSDYGAEPSNVTIRSTLLTAANFDAQSADQLSLRSAIGAITLGLLVGFTYGNKYETVSPKTPATNVYAQREAKWRVRYMGADDSGPYRMEIPCPNLTFLDVNNRGFLDLTSTEGDDFKTAFEAFVKLEGGTAVEVISVQHVGKNI